MPTFVYDESAASNSGVFLLDIPDITWFKDSVLTALAEMTIPENWRGDTEDYRQYALLQANLMMATYKVLNFNPFPVGIILPFASDATPPGYLLCDGNDYGITEYPELFSVIGYIYGGSDDRFNVPYTQNQIVIGSGDVYTLGQQLGSPIATLTEANLASHQHFDYGHSHTIPLTTDGLAVAPGELPVVVPIPILASSTGTTTIETTFTGSGESFSILNPVMAFPYMIYAGR